MGVDAHPVCITALPFEHDGKRLALVGLIDESELMQQRELLPQCGQCDAARLDDEATAPESRSI